jgi:quercetin 2,3-dioxygenase
MIRVRKAQDRGHADHDWLKSWHTFSFADYYDPRQMGFSFLRVINEDIVQPSTGFPTHGHRDMEIITYVIEGVLTHEDTLGNAETLKPGEVQRMSAGTGIRHSEYNKETSSQVHLLQIWIEPEKSGLPPSYEQKSFQKELSSGKPILVVSPDQKNNSLKIHQDVRIYASTPSGSVQSEINIGENRKAWIQVVSGHLNVNGTLLQAGDGGIAEMEKTLQLKSEGPANFLVFDLP